MTIEGDVVYVMVKSEESKKRQEENRKKRRKIDKMIKNDGYVEWLKNEHGVMDLDEIRGDKEFFNSLIKEIEKSREKKLVYDKKYQLSDLEGWKRKNKRKVLLREISEKAKMKKSEGR